MSIGRSVVGPSVRNAFVKIAENDVMQDGDASYVVYTALFVCKYTSLRHYENATFIKIHSCRLAQPTYQPKMKKWDNFGNFWPIKLKFGMQVPFTRPHVIIGKKSNYVIRFLNVGKKRGFPFFPWARLSKLSHYWGRVGPRMKFIPKV